MATRLFLLYVLVELAVVIALVSTIGFGWTFLLVVGTFALGLVLAGSQVKRQFRRLQAGLATPQGSVSDGALTALGIVLTVIPGLVSSALGLLLLLPPTRAVARPAVAAFAARSLGRMPLIVTPSMNTAAFNPAAFDPTVGPRPGAHRPRRGDVIEGEVIDVTDVEQPRLPNQPG